MPVLVAARKSWKDYSPAYRRRLERQGINSKNYRTAPRAKARGHAQTPERPEQAARNPERYKDYIARRSAEERQLIARKERIFGSSVHYKPSRAESNATTPPVSGKRTPSRLIRKFLRMSEDEALTRVSEFATTIKGLSNEKALRVIATDWSGDDWSFLFYH